MRVSMTGPGWWVFFEGKPCAKNLEEIWRKFQKLDWHTFDPAVSPVGGNSGGMLVVFSSFFDHFGDDVGGNVVECGGHLEDLAEDILKIWRLTRREFGKNCQNLDWHTRSRCGPDVRPNIMLVSSFFARSNDALHVVDLRDINLAETFSLKGLEFEGEEIVSGWKGSRQGVRPHTLLKLEYNQSINYYCWLWIFEGFTLVVVSLQFMVV